MSKAPGYKAQKTKAPQAPAEPELPPKTLMERAAEKLGCHLADYRNWTDDALRLNNGPAAEHWASEAEAAKHAFYILKGLARFADLEAKVMAALKQRAADITAQQQAQEDALRKEEANRQRGRQMAERRAREGGKR